MTYLHQDHRRILLVDQNRTKQTVRATILRNYEIEVHTASSITDAATLWKAYSYDLVLLAAQENSEEAATLSAQIRASKPRQRIGLLVGPPTFVRELGGRRRKAASLGEVSPSRAVESPSLSVSAPPASSPQWQVMVRKLVSDWYVDQGALLGLARLTNRIAGA